MPVVRRVEQRAELADIVVFTISGSTSGLIVDVMAPGATMTRCTFNGADVILRYADVHDHIVRAGRDCYLNSIVGRIANRIADATFLHPDSGDEVVLAANNGLNSLHGGLVGFDKLIWEPDHSTIGEASNSLTLKLTSEDGDEGYPGVVHARCRYTIEGDTLEIELTAETESPVTVVNMTTHTYWNLSSKPTIEDHQLQLPNMIGRLETRQGLIPTGNVLPILAGRFDFSQSRQIGENLLDVYPQAGDRPGYDHFYCLRDPDREPAARSRALVKAAILEADNIRMTMSTTELGVQVYTGNWLDGAMPDMRGRHFPRYAGIALEASAVIDAVNHPLWAPQVMLRKGDTYRSCTRYQFERITPSA